MFNWQGLVGLVLRSRKKETPAEVRTERAKENVTSAMVAKEIKAQEKPAKKSHRHLLWGYLGDAPVYANRTLRCFPGRGRL